MSDAGVLAAIECMEAWIRDSAPMPDPDVLAEWNREFQAAVAAAEHGPEWTNLVARAHTLGGRIQGRTALVAAERDALRLELDAQARGDRALKGYGAATR